MLSSIFTQVQMLGAQGMAEHRVTPRVLGKACKYQEKTMPVDDGCDFQPRKIPASFSLVNGGP